MTPLQEIVERAEEENRKWGNMMPTQIANERLRYVLKEYIESLQSAGNNTTAPMRAMVLMGRLSADLALLEGKEKS